MIKGHKLKNGLPNWDVLDPLIIAARKSGASLADIMATMKLSKNRASGRLSHLASIGMIDPSRHSSARRTTDEEKRIVAAEYPEGDVRSRKTPRGDNAQAGRDRQKAGVRRSASARSSQCREAALRTVQQRLATMREDDDKEDEEDAIDGRRKLLRNCATGQIFLLENGATLHRSWRDDAAYASYLSSRRDA
ncbi:MAG: hypothetical protein IPJ57_20955 [Gemmatimonadetes bacterium]|nr:hypothetical protein [Gemmatimonadota bacterium]